MKEVTRITTLRVTEIIRVEDEKDLVEKTEYGKTLANDCKEIFRVDDVVVDNVQDFILDKTE